ncbi:uncharacterized protein LOC117807576 [Xyrichtys novacula]|uniref:Uncharacterized protein LOC117807576 n=1 Tax=Xyrichtys novacula TaxID=13765 RepID=A0AAV1HML5_XYRNO|nr:uncharacterized protein LOC117807576 [Xyrichtys novacula]
MALTQLVFFLVLPVLFVNHLLWQSTIVLNGSSTLYSMAMVMKPMLHCLVCVDSYMAVVRPIDYLRFKGNQHRWGCLGAAWCIYILMGSIVIFKRSAVTACVVFFPVLAVDTFCCLSVLKNLQKSPPGDREMVEQAKKEKLKTEKSGCPRVSTKDGKQGNSREREGRKDKKVVEVYSSEPRAKKEMNSIKRKAFNTIIIIQVVLTLNYLPFIITFCMDGLVPAQRLKCEYTALSLAAAASCSYLHPVLYLHRLGRLREVKKQLVRHLCH